MNREQKDLVKRVWQKVKSRANMSYVEFKNLCNYIFKFCEENNYDWQEIDIQNLDWSLSYSELKNIIDKVLGKLEIPSKDLIEHYEIEATKREEEHYKQEFEKRINEIKNSSITELEKYYKDYYDHIEIFLENKVVNGFLVVGVGGIGKTFNLIKKLRDKNINFVMLKGHFTPLTFYRTLYEYRERSYLILDDVMKLADDKDIVSLLLGALDYDNRLVSWQSSSPLSRDLPREFVFNSKIFILANEFSENNEFLKALKDRCIFYELKFSREEILEMLYILAKHRKYPLEIVDYIKELSEKNFIKNLSLRLLDKVYAYYGKNNWQKLVNDIVEIDEVENLVYQLMKSNDTVKTQIEKFTKETGLSRRTFFRIKARISAKVSSVKYA
jgi:hypothetical protein